MSTDWILPAIATAAMGVAAASLTFAINTKTELALLRADVTRLNDNHDTDNRQDASIKKLWGYSSFLDTQTYRLIEKAGIPFPDRPDLSSR